MASERRIVSVKHFFSSGVYAKQQELRAGEFVMTHRHCYDHMSILAQGACKLTVDGVETEISAPRCVEIKANVSHRIEALQDSVWFCIHHTTETDVSKIDETLIHKE